MASASTQIPSSPFWVYDVFLSFNGVDTQKNFISHLYNALDHNGIRTYKGYHTFPWGEGYIPGILRTIELSRVSIVVFSKNYTSSEWCLDELVKILECKDQMGQTVLPVFYEMDPSDLTDQTEGYADSLAKHKARSGEDMERGMRWNLALKKAADLSGWDSRKSKDETQLIEEIIEVVSENLSHTLISNNENLVSIEAHIREMISLLHLHQSHEARMVGIWGMGGIGKTTVAKAVFDRLAKKFQGCCFLENVKNFKNHSQASLRNELLCQILLGGKLHKSSNLVTGFNEIKDRLSRRKVLIVLDDVDHLQQLESLAGNHDWFGAGSRVIITTRDKHLLTTHGVDDIYEVETLNNDNALKLFSRYAFKQNHPTEEFINLSNCAINYAKGLPLALKVLGSFLFGRSKPQWKDKLIELKSTPHMEIQNVLQISFDGLQRNEKKIFLDIACFYRGEDKGYLTSVLDSYGFSPVIGMEVLVEKCLISISNNKVWMHDLLQEMGWEIVRNESIQDPGRRSRLWTCTDAYNVLTQKMGTENVEGLILDLSKLKEIHFHVDAFAKMKNLRLLSVCNAPLTAVLEYHSKTNLRPRSNTYTWVNEFKQLNYSETHLLGDFEFFSQELRCLYWHGYPLKSLPSHFDPMYLFELDLCYSHVEQLWIEKKLVLQKLEFINLSHSKSLIRTPDFEGIPNLRRLILDCCTHLIEVHPSVGDLKKLVVLSLKNCQNLENFPSEIRLESLEILILSGCSNLKKFPEVMQQMDHLFELCLDGTAIKELPSSIQNLIGVVLLNLRDCKNLLYLPEGICSLKTLRSLILGGCRKLVELPSNFGNLRELEELDIGGTSLKMQLDPVVYANDHTRFSNLQQLEELDIGGTSLKMQSYPIVYAKSFPRLYSNRFIGQLRHYLSSFKSSLKELVKVRGFSCFGTLRSLQLADHNLSANPSNNFSLDSGEILEFRGISSPAFSHCNKLTRLRLSDCNLSAIPVDFFSLYSLTDLDLSNNNFVSIPSCIDRLSVLEYLRVNCCTYLRSLPALPASIAYVYAHGCISLQKVSGMSLVEVPEASSIAQQWDYRSFFLTNCFKLATYEGLNNIIIPLLTSQLQSLLMRQILEQAASYAHIKIFVPGSCIPSWFSHQCEESSTTIELSRTALMGVAVCTVFTTRNHQDDGKPCSLDICVQFNEDNHREVVCVLELEEFLESDHLGLSYAAFPKEWRNKSGSITITLEHNKQNVEVKKFGVRLVFPGIQWSY